MAKKQANPTTYSAGFKVEYTGKVEELYGGTFYQVRVLEGPAKGELRDIVKAPGAGHSERRKGTMSTMNHRERQELRDQLAEVTNLRHALRAFAKVDTSLKITLGPYWLDRANMVNVIADINAVLLQHLVPNADGKLISIFKLDKA